ncbi:Uma2 family endonuclease [Conchiformibius kuhniae]|uniref:Uma2 family endonuclease n=1 Tax=Conchiformibius kuhniae TaxID=211502 RepID=A0A8T9MZ58_9NEIS|nr:Uma2 family endonuclease [Conchiformibius kuhniae]UOP05083.1 Uma2 family endonuclease [Conchiformibius kuhniae]
MSETALHTPAEARYFALCDSRPDEKFELYNGEIYAMGNTSFNHDLLKSQFGRKIGNHFDDNHIRCREIIEGKLHIGKNYFIPDIMVVYKKPKETAFSEPVVIVEILSDSTRAKDFGFKFREYS